MQPRLNEKFSECHNVNPQITTLRTASTGCPIVANRSAVPSTPAENLHEPVQPPPARPVHPPRSPPTELSRHRPTFRYSPSVSGLQSARLSTSPPPRFNGPFRENRSTSSNLSRGADRRTVFHPQLQPPIAAWKGRPPLGVFGSTRRALADEDESSTPCALSEDLIVGPHDIFQAPPPVDPGSIPPPKPGSRAYGLRRFGTSAPPGGRLLTPARERQAPPYLRLPRKPSTFQRCGRQNPER